MITEAEIYDFKTWIIEKRNGERKREQEEDQEFFNNKYDLPMIKDAKYTIRTGDVADMANTITNRLIGSNPRCYTEPRTEGENIKKSADRVAAICNRWLQFWLKAHSNPYRKTFKNKFVKGESYVYMAHDETLAKWLPSKHEGKTWKEVMPNAVPVIPVFYDPLVVFVDPAEEVNGQPSRMVVSFKRSIDNIKSQYPFWNGAGDSNLIDYFLYIDKEVIYAYAGEKDTGMPLFTNKKGLINGTGIRKNIYREVPCIHRYSGWGIENASKDPELLAFSRIRQLRDLVVEDSTMASDFSKNIHTTAAPHRTLFLTSSAAAEFDQETALAGYSPSPDSISVVILPDGTPKENFGVEETLTYGPEVFAYAAQVKSRLNAKHPPPMRGLASGSSGRQEDILSEAGEDIYDCAVENNNQLWADTLGLALRIASNKDLDILPTGLEMGDYNNVSELTVNLRKDDPIQLARKTAMVERQWQMGLITHEKALMEMGRTKEEAKKETAESWIEMIMRNSPEIIQIIVQIMAQEMGEEEKLEQIKEQVGNVTKGLNPAIKFGSQGGEPRTGNVKTETGREQADLMETRPTRLPAGVS